MVFTPPLGQIGLIEKGNSGSYDPTLSAKSTAAMRQILLQYKRELRLSGELSVPDPRTQQRLTRETYRAINAVERQQRVGRPYELVVLDSLLDAQGQRYALLSAARGFTRVEGNYSNQVAKSVGVGLLTLGMYVPVPIKATSSVFFLIYDRQDHAILYYNHAAPLEAEPLDPAVLDKQMRKMLAKDFHFPPKS